MAAGSGGYTRVGYAVIAGVILVCLAGAALLVSMIASYLSTSESARPSVATPSVVVTGCPGDLWLDPQTLVCVPRTACASGESFDALTNGCTPARVTAVSLTPSSGPLEGGTELTITGSGFAAGVTVTIGGIPATNINVIDPTTMTADTPAGLNLYALDVVVTVPGREPVTLNNVFTYLAPADQAVQQVLPNTGAVGGGETVVIKGRGFVDGVKVAFNGVLATNVITISSTTISVTTPAGPLGPVNVNVRNPDREPLVLTGGFSYVDAAARRVTGVLPTNGTAAGGTEVTIKGSGFAQGATVGFGGRAASRVRVVSSTTITAVTPPGTVGRADVTVRNPGLPRSTLARGYGYVAAPVVLAVSPATGSVAGGTQVTISGSGFEKGARVMVGGAAARSVKVISDTRITAVVPPGKAGPATVTVVNAGQPEGSLAEAFTYLVAPAR
jgi:hypothetical protein